MKAMSVLIKIIAKIKLLSGGRRTPFVSGYRPLFNFKNASTKISGRIDLIDSSQFEPGAEGLVYITFIRGMIADKSLIEGEDFTFGESEPVLGEGEIVQILGS